MNTLDYSAMTKEDLIYENTKLYSRIKSMSNSDKEFDKRNKILNKKGVSIKIGNIVFKPGKSSLTNLIENIIYDNNPDCELMTIIPQSMWKVSFEKRPTLFKNLNSKSIWVSVINKVPYFITFIDTKNKMFSVIISRAHNSQKISSEIKISDIPLSSNGYGICYYNC